MQDAQYNYNALRGRIREICGTQETFARCIRISPTSLSQKLNNATRFTQTEINRACQVLNIDDVDIKRYFFTSSVQ